MTAPAATQGATSRPRASRWSRIRTTLVLIVAAAVLPVAAGFLGISAATDDIYPPRGPSTPTVPPPQPTLDPDRPTAAIVLGKDGANVADALAPFEVFATTGRFNVVTVAPTPDPVTLTGGLDVVPDLTFAQLDARLSEPPEVIVVPQIPGSTATVQDWLREQRRQGAPLLMSVCVGAEILADAGILEGRPATSHWLKLIGLRRSHPDVDWTDGVRLVDDGDIITTGGVLSGIDGALRVVERLIGPAQAERTARALRWPGYRPGASLSIPTHKPRPGDLVALLSAAYRWNRPSTGVLLFEGVGEISLAAAFRPYTELSYLARLQAVSADGEAVRSRHGLTFLPRSDWDAATAQVDRILVPGPPPGPSVTDLLRDAPIPMDHLHRADEFPFNGALRDIADTYDIATARWVAKSLQYPTPDDLPGRLWPWTLIATPLLLAALGIGVAITTGQMARRLGGRRP